MGQETVQRQAATGLRQCLADPDGESMDVETMEKLFLSLA